MTTPWRGAGDVSKQRWEPLMAITMLTAVTLVGGCSVTASPTAGSQGWPPSTPEVAVTMYDYGFDFDTPVPAGRVVFRVRNTGSVTHRVTLVPLPEDMPPIDEQLHSDNRRGVHPVAGVNPRSPGGSSVFAVDLEEGRRYALICYQEDDDGVVHALKGGNAEFRAGGPDTEPPGDSPG